MKSKEVKLIIRNDSDPEIYKWATSLKYGVFPKLVLEILRWYERNGLLVRGAVNHPDILPPRIPLNEFSHDEKILNEILQLVRENNQVLRSNEFISPAETKSENRQIEPDHPSLVKNHLSASDIKSTEDLEAGDEYEKAITSMPNIPMPFKVYK